MRVGRRRFGNLRELFGVIWVLLAMLVILLLAGLVATYVAYPARGQDVPGAPWVGDVLERGVDALPTLDHERSSLRS